jgi:hypothetical protein
MQRDLRQHLSDWFDEELLRKQVGILLHDLDAVASRLLELGEAQRTLAWSLSGREKALGRTLVDEALNQLKATILRENVSLYKIFKIAENMTQLF